MPESAETGRSSHDGETFGDVFRGAEVGLVRFDEPLSRHSSWRIGGPADVMVEPGNMGELAECCRLVARHQIPCVVIGHGTNLLFDDEGLRGVVVKIAGRMAKWRFESGRLWAEAGLWVPRLARIAARLGLTGIEHVVGIPGTVGGLTVMNGGSGRRCIGEHIMLVRAVERAAGSVTVLDQEACDFSYRSSRFQSADLVVGEVQFACERGHPARIRGEMLRILRRRSRKFPRKEPSCGSVFVSDARVYGRFGSPGKVIEEAGLKGRSVGSARVSEKHANFIVNLGGASSRDVLELIDEVRARVLERMGVSLQSEVRYSSPEGHVCSASEAARQRE